ncbi:hypothetical protein PGTUg99_016377 [Puccinia graminis f. sp. tritici]|uniref:Uncharacterized protein n=1 Tax=Puccinia graminis f. sp. tritici TaxID=56615 RepID=A0A5B0RWD8_PUCGR|nr:hypothetical protein PGTUg99_016377 [Puccinia graminis f. sp. tritici]
MLSKSCPYVIGGPVSSVGRAFGFYCSCAGSDTEMSGVRAPHWALHFSRITFS